MDANAKVALRTLLANYPEVLKELRDSAPKCAGATMEESAMTGRERQGWQNAAQHLEDMAKPDNTETEATPFIQE